jgi:hypothetical protein
MVDPLARLAETAPGLQKVRDALLAGSQQAGGQGDWALARKLIDLAERADALRQETMALAGGAGKAEAAPETPGEAARRPMPQRCPGCGYAEVSPRARTCAKCGHDFGGEKRGGFPRFSVRGGMLVKKGLQRDGRSVYEHAVPQDKFDQILARLAALAAGRDEHRQKGFTVDDVQRGLDCPKYMTYVVVSLMLREGLLVRPRKGAYLFAAPGEFSSEAGGLWGDLQKRGERD